MKLTSNLEMGWLRTTGFFGEGIASAKLESRRKIIAGVLYALASMLIVLTGVAGAGTQLSWLDEHTHLDYAWRASHGEIPARGDTIDRHVLNYWACEGRNSNSMPRCGWEAPPNLYPYEGQNYNYGHPPLYYAVTGIAARVLSAVSPYPFELTARWLGGVWLAGGMFALFLGLRRWRADPLLALVAPLLLPTFPRIFQSTIAVNPDAAGALAGGLALWFAGRIIVDREAPWKSLAAWTLAISLIKVIAVVPFLALAILLAIKAVRRTHTRKDALRYGMAAALIVAVVGATYLSWQAFQSGRGAADYVNPVVGVNTRDVSGLPFSEWFGSVFSGMGLASDYDIEANFNIAALAGWTQILNVIVIGSGFAVIVSFAKWSARKSPGWMLVIGSLLYPLAVQIQTYTANAVPQYFPVVTNRYGLSLIPVAVGCIVLAGTHAGYRWFVMLLTASGLGVLALTISNAVYLASSAQP